MEERQVLHNNLHTLQAILDLIRMYNDPEEAEGFIFTVGVSSGSATTCGLVVGWLWHHLHPAHYFIPVSNLYEKSFEWISAFAANTNYKYKNG